MTNPQSDPIDAVLLQLDEIVAWCLANGSRAGYFAALYRRVTRTVRQRIGTATLQTTPAWRSWTSPSPGAT
jgi:uncharacterized protein CbrC (UPF0167 family)